jgi:hypothetical protein
MDESALTSAQAAPQKNIPASGGVNWLAHKFCFNRNIRNIQPRG